MFPNDFWIFFGPRLNHVWESKIVYWRDLSVVRRPSRRSIFSLAANCNYHLTDVDSMRRVGYHVDANDAVRWPAHQWFNFQSLKSCVFGVIKSFSQVLQPP